MTPSPSNIEMKDSGVPWVGLIPSTWDMKRAKFLFSLAQRAPRQDDGIVTAFRDGQVTLRSNRRTDGFTNALKETGYQRVHKGDLVIHAMDAFAGAIGVSDSDGKCTPVYSCCIPGDETSSEFYARCVRTMSTTGFIESLAKGIRERSTDFRWATFAEQLLPHPPKAEQDAIVAYLDRATSRIDTLVAKKTRFIELLREKRQALITHAVTKGLDPNVPMKDSGVEWLGKVPESWDVGAARRFFLFNPSKREISTRPRSEEVSFLPMEAIGETGTLDLTRTRQIKEVETGYSYFANGDVVIAKITPCFENGKGSAIGGLVGGVGFGTTELIVLRPSRHVSQQYSWWLFSAAGFRRFAEGHMEGSAGQKRVQDDWLKAQKVAIPPRPVQDAIVAHLDRATSRIDTLISKTERSIELLREHRTALITAAVTGKIYLSS